MINIPLDICSGMSHITYIHITDKNPATLWWKYVLEGVGVSDWTASALLVNIIILQTRSNSKTCAYTLIYELVQLILACNGSIMPRSSALIRILTNSHIIPYTTHMTMIFTYSESHLYPLLSYIHSMSLCYTPLTRCRTCVALLMWVLNELRTFVLPPTPRLSNTLLTPRNQHPSDLWWPCSTHWWLRLLSGTAPLPFFRRLMKLATTAKSSIPHCNTELYTWLVSIKAHNIWLLTGSTR